VNFSQHSLLTDQTTAAKKAQDALSIITENQEPEID
jgi:hypothetical protein